MKLPIKKDGITYRRLERSRDSFEDITKLLHRAYKRLLDMGLRYVATKQTVATTIGRCTSDECYVAVNRRQVCGVIAFERAQIASDTAWYDRPEVACFSQFAVEPSLQNRGIGQMLIAIVEARAYETGAFEIALDTAIPAKHLVRYYKSLGYRKVDEHQWRGANYRSVIMSKRLDQRPLLAEQRPRIFVHGTVCADHVQRVPKIPEIGRYVEVTETRYLLGGEAANSAAWLAHWGANHLLVANAIGNDHDGVIVQHRLQELNVQYKALELEHNTPHCDVYVDDTGNRTMFGHGFAGLRPKDFPALRGIRKQDWLTVDSNSPPAALEACRRAASVGAHIYVMDIWDLEFMNEIANDKALVIWQSSASWLKGQDPLAFVRNWSRKAKCIALLTKAEDGVYISEQGKDARHIRAPFVVKAFDATGAGDVFRAGVIYQLSCSADLDSAVQFAQAAAALKCAHWGATTFQADAADVWHSIAARTQSKRKN